MLPVTRAPRPRTTARRSRAGRLAGLVTGVTSCLLAAGCAGLHPGAAVVVGEEVVSEDRLDLASRALCTYFEPELEQRQQSVPLVEVRRSAAVLLGLRSAVEQLAAHYDASPGSDFNREVTRIEGLAERLPEEEREAFLEVQGAQSYVPITLAEVGGQVLEAEGDPQGADADLTDRTAAGLRVLLDFLEGEEVEFAPSLGLDVEVPELPEAPTLEESSALIGGLFVPVDSSASVAVTDTALAASGGAGEPGQPGAADGTLPADQRCG